MTTFFKKVDNKFKNLTQAIHQELQDFIYSKPSKKIIPKTLLIIKVDSIGDYVIFRNFLSEIRTSKKFRDYKITLLGNVWYKELAEEYDKDTIDEFIWVDLLKLKKENYFNETVKRIFKSGFEYCISPNYSMAAEDVKLLARSGAKYKICPKGDDINMPLDQKIKYLKKFTSIIDTKKRFDFEFYRYKAFFELLLSDALKVNNVYLPVATENKKQIIICPGANSAFRKWSVNNYAGLLDLINNNFPEFDYLIIGSEGESELGEQIIATSKTKNVSNLCGKLTLTQLAELIAGSTLLITNDTGPYHISMALGKKTVCISNGNNYNRFTPYPDEFKKEAFTILSDKVQELVKQPDKIKNFQNKGSQENINEISVEKVFKAVTQLLKNG